MGNLEERKQIIKNRLFGWVEDNYDKTFIVILIIAFFIRLWIFTITKDQPVWWDAADYLAAAKRWAGFNPNLIDMWYYRRGLFWPLLESLFFVTRLGELGIRFLLILFSAGIVGVSYFLVKAMFNKKLALFVSICLTFSWIFLFFTGRPLNNLPASFFLLLSLLFFWKGYALKQGNKFLYLFGLFFAIASLTRMQYLISAIPILVFIFTRERFKFLSNKNLWITLGIFILVFIPQLYLHYQHFGNPLTDLSTYYLGIKGSESGEIGVELAQPSDLFLYFNNLPYILDANQKGYNTLLVFSPLYLVFIIGFFIFLIDTILGLDKLLKDGEIQKKVFILFWVISSFLFLGYIAPQLEQRYVMDNLPFLFIILAYPYGLLEKNLVKRFKIKEFSLTILVCVILLLLLIPNFIFGYNLIESKKNSYLEVKQAGLWIKDNSIPKDIIISDSLPQITYYSERSTYPFSLAYRRDLTPKNESDLDEFIKLKKPKYLILSSFERHPDWAYLYPEKHQDLLVPVRIYKQNDQPVLVIYEFKY